MHSLCKLEIRLIVQLLENDSLVKSYISEISETAIYIPNIDSPASGYHVVQFLLLSPISEIILDVSFNIGSHNNSLRIVETSHFS